MSVTSQSRVVEKRRHREVEKRNESSILGFAPCCVTKTTPDRMNTKTGEVQRGPDHLVIAPHRGEQTLEAAEHVI